MRLSTISAGSYARCCSRCTARCRPCVLALVPVLSGALAGVAAVSLGFGAVHGITLGFGTTLIGEAVDYSIYLFVQSGGRVAADTALLADHPAGRAHLDLRLLGAALLGLPGARAAGPVLDRGPRRRRAGHALRAAALLPRGVRSVRDLSAGWRAAGARAGGAARAGTRLPALALLALAAGAVLYDAARRALGAATSEPQSDLRSRPSASTRAARRPRRRRTCATSRSPRARTATGGARGGRARGRAPRRRSSRQDVSAATRARPASCRSAATQRARQASLPAGAASCARACAAALAGLPLPAAARALRRGRRPRARAAAPLDPRDLAGTALAAALDALLLQTPAGWTALLPVRRGRRRPTPASRGAAARRGRRAGRCPLLDLKAEVDALYGGLLRSARCDARARRARGRSWLLLFAALRAPARVARVMAPLVAAVLVVAALLRARRHAPDPPAPRRACCWWSRSAPTTRCSSIAGARPARGAPRTLASLALANVTTVSRFGVLALSRIPVLRDARLDRGARRASGTAGFSGAAGPPGTAAVGRADAS